MTFRPMLAAKDAVVEELKYPLIASPKLDGVRAIIIQGTVYSRSMKPIPNLNVQSMFGRNSLNWLDGELIMGEPTSATAFRDTMSAVMTITGSPDVKFHVFDEYHADQRFVGRYAEVGNRIANMPNVVQVPHVAVFKPDDVLYWEHRWLEEGYEGLMLRDPNGKYKQGRSTLSEAGLMKVKRFADSEALVIGAIELMHNDNVAELDERGYMKRSSHQENKRPAGKLGALSVRDLTTGVEFEIGTGFTDGERCFYWGDGNVEALKGRIARYRYFPTGSKDKPRFPVFQGFRNPEDL